MTTKLVTVIITIWLSWGVRDRDVSRAQQFVRLRPIATVIVEVTDDPDMQVALAYTAWKETRLAAYVLRGECFKGKEDERCDPDENGNPRAMGPWQLHEAACRAAWKLGPTSYKVQATCARKLFEMYRYACGNRWAGAFSAYATGGTCPTFCASNDPKCLVILRLGSAREADRQRFLREYWTLVQSRG